MKQVLGPGALGRPRGIGWRGRWEGGSGWGIHVYPRLIHVNVWQKPLQHCEVISLQLIQINEKKNKNKNKTLHPTTAEYTLFSNAHRTYIIIDHILSHKNIPTNLK